MKLNISKIPQQLLIQQEFALREKYNFKQKEKESKNAAIFSIQSKEDLMTFNLKISKKQSDIEQEATILKNCGGYPGFPLLLEHKQFSEFSYLISQKLGQNLEQLKQKCNGKFKLKTCCKLAIDLLSAMQFLHKALIIHSNINPQNILIGEGDSANKIYLGGLGKAITVRKAQNKDYKDNNSIYFQSINAQQKNPLDKRDDMISLCYLLAYFYKGTLPWIGDKFEGNTELIVEMKQNVSLSTFCNDLPKEIKQFFEEVNQLPIGKEPEYDKYKNLFSNILKDVTQNNIKMQNYEWITVMNPKIESQTKLTRKIQNKLLDLIQTEIKQSQSSTSSFTLSPGLSETEDLEENLELEKMMQAFNLKQPKFISYIKKNYYCN